MNLSDIITKCYILALIIRDDGERLLLGDGTYEFKSSLQHFAPNIYQNDIVELQGTDGQLLAGQVRRSATQAFDGYIADGTIAKTTTEQSRRRFLAFFRKKHHYKVVYIMPDGTAVQRDRGYIVDAPAVQELYQLFPEYHIGLNFEDPNYYEYEEDSEGEEIPANTALISLANLLAGGLIWDAFGAVSQEKTWLDWENGDTVDGFYQYTNGLAGAPLSLTHLYGNAEQKTLSGKNLAEVVCRTTAMQGITATYNSGTGVITLSGTATTVYSTPFQPINVNIPAGTYTLKQYGTLSHGRIGVNLRRADNTQITEQLVNTSTLQNTFTLSEDAKIMQLLTGGHQANDSVSGNIQLLLVAGTTAGDFEPYCGGIPSPNPDYPQEIKTVTGAQTVKITGKNLWNPDNAQAFVTAINNTNQAKLDTHDGKSCLYWTAGAGYGSYPTKNFTLDIKFKENTQYAISYDTLKTTTAKRTVAICYTDGTYTRAEDLPSTNTWVHQTIISDANKTIAYVAPWYTSGESYLDIDTFQIEEGTQVTPYEPYQAQSYEINLGKNLFDTDTAVTRFEAYNGNAINDWGTYSDGIVTIVKSNGVHGTCAFAGFKPKFVEGQTYTLSAKVYLEGTNASKQLRFGTVTNSNTAITIASKDEWLTVVKTFTATASDVSDPRIDIQAYNTGNTLRIKEIQLEAGSQATPYSAYKTPIELAKIGTYQDYIWNDDGTWKIHKEVGKVVYDGTETWGTQNDVFTINNNDAKQGGYDTEILVNSDYFTGQTTRYRGEIKDGGCAKIVGDNQQVGFKYSALNNDTDAFKTWLGTHNTTVYYALATPTDTEITDSELITQLSAITNTYQGINNLWLIPSAGAQGELSVHYATGSIDVGAGYEWEEGSDTGTNIIVNNGIDSVNPTWIVPGPATNPTLTNITTGQTIVWEGSVASGQTLTVDLNRQTAELGGTNVFAQLSGDWVRLAPGPNKLAYSATGATEGCRLEWNGVVG